MLDPLCSVIAVHLSVALKFLSCVAGEILIYLKPWRWFESSETGRRARVLIATFAAIAAGGVSRILQYKLPTHPRRTTTLR